LESFFNGIVINVLFPTPLALILTIESKKLLVMKTTILKLFIASTLIFAFASCSKLDRNSDSNSDKARMQVFLTDDPGPYEAVLVDVQDVQINYADDTVGWHSLPNVKAGKYDLLTLVNDKDTMLADASINTGTIEQIRLILGTENYVKINGQLIKLETPSAQQSGLKLNLHQAVTAGILYKVILDFDAAKSIVKAGNSGKYILKPTIRTTLEAQGGSIKGFVLPDTVTTAVLAIQGPDTIASTFTGSNGGYLIRGLAAGTYSLSFIPNDTTFKNELKSGIAVTTGNVTVVDTVHLHQ
jgi:hypothetical protein